MALCAMREVQPLCGTRGFRDGVRQEEEAEDATDQQQKAWSNDDQEEAQSRCRGHDVSLETLMESCSLRGRPPCIVASQSCQASLEGPWAAAFRPSSRRTVAYFDGSLLGNMPSRGRKRLT